MRWRNTGHAGEMEELQWPTLEARQIQVLPFGFASGDKNEVSREFNRFVPSSFPTDRSNAVPLLQVFFVCASVISYVGIVVSLFVPLISPSLCALGGLCFVIVAYPEYLHIFFR